MERTQNGCDFESSTPKVKLYYKTNQEN